MNMFGLAHFDVTPIIYGIVIFIGLFSMYYKFTHHMIFGAVVEVFVFVLVFKLHGGTMTGGFAATIAALLAGLIIHFFSQRKTF